MVSTGKEKSTFGTRMPIDIRMLNEIIFREVKHFKNYKIYRPNFEVIPVTGKFYASHDMLNETTEQAKKIDNYVNSVAQARAMGPHSKYSSPATSNQTYGWYNTPIVSLERNDKRFYQPRIESSHTKVEIIIRMSNPTSKTKSKPADQPKKLFL